MDFEREYLLAELAPKIGVTYAALNKAFKNAWIDWRRCRKVGGRRLVPESYVEEVIQILTDRGVLKRKRELAKA